jgi:hypothetical protein
MDRAWEVMCLAERESGPLSVATRNSRVEIGQKMKRHDFFHGAWSEDAFQAALDGSCPCTATGSTI